MNRPNAVKEAKVIQVIETKSVRGLGTEKDPVRVVTQYWDLDGKFLAEMDPELCIPLVELEAKAIKESTLEREVNETSAEQQLENWPKVCKEFGINPELSPVEVENRLLTAIFGAEYVKRYRAEKLWKRKNEG